MITKTALIVDDSKLAQFVLKSMLAECHIEVDTSESAEEALSYLADRHPDVIFMDHTMPGMDGLQALKIIKENPNTAAIPVMMYTSQYDNTYTSQAKSLGAVDILPKQLKPLELQRALQQLKLIDNPKRAVQQQQPEPMETKSPKVPINTQAGIASRKLSQTAPEKEELSKLLRRAESALEKETIKQFVQQELEKQHRRFTIILQKISHGLNELSHTKADAKTATHTPIRAGLIGLLWPLLLMVTIAVFGLLYLQLQQSLLSIQHSIDNVIRGNNSKTAAVTADDRQLNMLIMALEQAININGAIPWEEQLLSEYSMKKIAAFVPSLHTARFKGEVQVIAHSGNFCLLNHTNNELVVPDAETPLGDCQITPVFTTLEQMMTEKFRYFIEDINNKHGDNFYITVSSRGSGQPLVDYPDANAVTTAGEWNAVARQNRRIEIMLNAQ